MIVYKHVLTLLFMQSLAIVPLYASKIVHFNAYDLEKLDPQTLVVTDINDTIIECLESIWLKPTLKALTGKGRDKQQNLNSKQQNLLANLMMQRCTNVEKSGSGEFFRALKAKNIPTVALTAAFSEPIDGVDMAELTESILQKQRIEFNPPLEGTIAFDKLKEDPISGQPPKYKNGVLSTNGSTHSKGEVLTNFILLLKEEKKPKKVVFFDDSPSHLSAVEQAMKKLGVEVEVVHMQTTKPGLSKLSSSQQAIWESLLDRVLLQ